MERASHHGRATAYRVAAGAGAPLLCLHGSGGTHALWRGQFRLDRSVVALDLSGHGGSDDVDTDPGPETLDAYADDAVAVARETGARAFAGNSLGGAVALHVALERDLSLDALVLAGTGAKLSVRPDLLGWLQYDFERAVDFLHGPDRLLHADDEALLAASREAMRGVGRAVTHRDFATCDAFDVRDRLGEIDVPAIALAGEHDTLTPPRYHAFLADRLPDAAWTTIDAAAHLSMLERPDAFNAVVGPWLDARC